MNNGYDIIGWLTEKGYAVRLNEQDGTVQIMTPGNQTILLENGYKTTITSGGSKIELDNSSVISITASSINLNGKVLVKEYAKQVPKDKVEELTTLISNVDSLEERVSRLEARW